MPKKDQSEVPQSIQLLQYRLNFSTQYMYVSQLLDPEARHLNVGLHPLRPFCCSLSVYLDSYTCKLKILHCGARVILKEKATWKPLKLSLNLAKTVSQKQYQPWVK